MTNIPYKGASAALPDVISGRVPLGFFVIPSVKQHLNSQRLRVLGVASLKRTKLMPTVPAVAETLPGYEMSGWYGIWAPAGTPPAVIAKIQTDVASVVRTPDFEAFLAENGFELISADPAAMGQVMSRETQTFRPLVERLTLVLD
jgi:tripartite-type tricarboxylate transporter receptor subunit TctC